MVSITYINGDVQVSDTVSPRTLCAKYDSKSCNMNHSALLYMYAFLYTCTFTYMYMYMYVAYCFVLICSLA